ncbi:unnamed protein product, partial [Mesorhabditis spiculigera]
MSEEKKGTRKAAGWKFEFPQVRNGLKVKTRLLIRHWDPGNPAFDPPTLREYVNKINEYRGDDLEALLSLLPAIGVLVDSIPWTLPIFEALYLHCEERQFFDAKQRTAALQAPDVFSRIVWWVAYLEQSEKDGKSCPKTLPSLESHERPLAALLGVIARRYPAILTRAASDKRQLELSLESLGCHGLVNSSKGLIRIEDASKHEMSRKEDKLKSNINELKEITEKSNENKASPSSASHQRQMQLKLSEISVRLQHNEGVEKLLAEATSNNHLTSLLRIARKRVASDRLLVGLFNAFKRAAPTNFQIDSTDPVIAEIIVIFNAAYEKLLHIASYQDYDSGCSNESGSEPGTTATPNSSDSIQISTAISSTSLASESGEMRRVHEYPIRNYHNPNPDDTLRLRLHIDHLKNELTNAKAQVEHLMKNSVERHSERLWPEPDYPEATSYYNCSSQEDVRALIQRFSDLFDKDKGDLMATLNCLPEFRGSEELQMKTILSVAVLTYRSVLESVLMRLNKIFDVIEEGEEKKENEEANMLEVALYRHMYRRAKSQHGMSNAKEVTTQIWHTLYDFPSLKTCTRFNRFVLECVDVCWDLVAGIDGRYPRMRIEYEATLFDSEKHTRFEASDPSRTQIRSVLWPGLRDQNTNRVLLKAVVLT